MSNVLQNPVWLNIVFESRNQSYGAYRLRLMHTKHQFAGLFFTLVVSLAFISLFTIQARNGKVAVKEEYRIHELTLPNIEPAKPIPIEIKLPLKEVHRIQQAQKKFLLPKVENQESPTMETIPTVEELANHQIASVDSKGELSAAESLHTEAATPLGSEIVPTEAEPLVVADVMPSFNGSFSKYMAEHLIYPRQALQHHVEGKLYVEFIIGPQGQILSAKIIKGLGYGCDEAVLKAIAGMPAWLPGMVNGKEVTVKLVLPVNFKLAKDN